MNMEQAPFTWRAAKDDRVFIYWQGREAAVLRGNDARKFLDRIERLDDEDAQLLMAKATGNFKRGNER